MDFKKFYGKCCKCRLSTDLICKYYRRVYEYEHAYLDGKKGGKGFENAVKVYKSHRRMFSN